MYKFKKEKSDSKAVCIQKQSGDKDRKFQYNNKYIDMHFLFLFVEWEDSRCDSKVEPLGNDDGKNEVFECLCSGLHPTTIISDIEGIF